MRDCPAIKTPESADNNSKRRFLTFELIYPNSLKYFHLLNKVSESRKYIT
jgi:hypothetical protein